MANWIHDIEIKNFKSIRHQKIEDCRRVNVFIGYPNVGKSNILEALTTIQYSKLQYSRPLRDFIRFEDAGELFFEANVREDAIISYNHSKSIHLKYNNKESIDFASVSYTEGASRLVKAGTQNNLDMVDVYQYHFMTGKGLDSGSTYKHLDSPWGENLFLQLREKKELRKSINEVLNEYNLKLLIDKTSNSLKLIRTIDSDSIFQLSYFLLADTLQRLFFYQAAIHSNKKSILLFEEPESHMFPPYISRFTSDVIHDDNSNQFFIATHSPFVLNDFMEDLKDKELSIYAVGFKKETGETIIRRLTDEEITEVYQYGIDLFFNLETFLKDAV